MRIGFLAGVAVIAVLALAGCGEDDNEPAAGGGGPDVDLVNDGAITTCTHLPYEPFQFEQGGKIVGFDVDLVDLVAKKLGVKQEIVDTPFEGIQSGEDLNARKCDIAAAAMTITDERAEKIDFSDAVLRRQPGAARQEGQRHQVARRPRGQDARRPVGHDGQDVRRGERARGRRAQGLRGPRARAQQRQERPDRGRHQRHPGAARLRQEEPGARGRGPVRDRRAVRLRHEEGHQRRAAHRSSTTC